MGVDQRVGSVIRPRSMSRQHQSSVVLRFLHSVNPTWVITDTSKYLRRFDFVFFQVLLLDIIPAPRAFWS